MGGAEEDDKVSRRRGGIGMEWEEGREEYDAEEQWVRQRDVPI